MTDIENPTAALSAETPAANPNEITALMRDGREDKLNIRTVPPSRFEKIPSPVGEELSFLAVVCSRPKEWFDELASGEYETLVAAAEQANRDFYGWWRRRLHYLSQVPPQVVDRAASAVRGDKF